MKEIIKKYFDIPENFYSTKNLTLIIATLGGIGFFKKGPGTLASFVTLIVIVGLSYFSSLAVAVSAFIFTMIGLFVSEDLTNNNEDPSYIVIDEAAGMTIALLAIQNNIALTLIAFVVFRILDIYKPWIIKRSETYFSNGAAVMIDDIIAGCFTLVLTIFLSILI